jgi:hypothetical protein
MVAPLRSPLLNDRLHLRDQLRTLGEVGSGRLVDLTPPDLADLAPTFVPDRLLNRDLCSATIRRCGSALCASRLARSSARCAFIRSR